MAPMRCLCSGPQTEPPQGPHNPSCHALTPASGHDSIGRVLAKILERYPPSVLLVEIVAAVGTFFGGLKFAVIFILGVYTLFGGLWLDGYGVRRDTR